MCMRRSFFRECLPTYSPCAREDLYRPAGDLLVGRQVPECAGWSVLEHVSQGLF